MDGYFPKRVGRFYLQEEFIKHLNDDTRRMLFGEMIILRVEYLYAQRTFEYVAASEMFDELSEAQDIPTYVMQFADGALEARRT